MARLALVSRNPIMSMGLSALDHDIVEVRPSAIDTWLEAGNDADVDAIVLDLGSPSVALRLVGDLRANARWTPVLLVASDDPGWDSPDLMALPGVDVLALPLDSARLRSATASVLRHPTAPPVPKQPSVHTAPDPLIDDVEVVFEVHEPSFLVADPQTDPLTAPLANAAQLQGAPNPSPSTTPPSSPEPPLAIPIPVKHLVVERPSAEPAAAIPVREIEVPPEPTETAARTKRQRRERAKPAQIESEVKTHRAKPARQTKHRDVSNETKPDRANSVPVRPKPSQKPRRRATDKLGDQAPPELVTLLLSSAERLYTLSETAEVIVEDAIRQASASGGALLVPDAGVWRVAGGAGLRPMEHRYQLPADSWLVERVGASLKGVLIEDSDVARRHLHGAPLASRAHLLAVPVAAVSSILLLSRDEDPAFTEVTLGDLGHLAEEAGPLLQRALDLRTLSRALDRHLDPVDIPPS